MRHSTGGGQLKYTYHQAIWTHNHTLQIERRPFLQERTPLTTGRLHLTSNHKPHLIVFCLCHWPDCQRRWQTLFHSSRVSTDIEKPINAMIRVLVKDTLHNHACMGLLAYDPATCPVLPSTSMRTCKQEIVLMIE